ncbi:hypothetical protein CHGG_00592 [Chaetomium globosum CBS 148.51]|uniref:Uncharacterized protein n=1 Tax=Chaetomium globosum (strain ATCC 6205 / CBS 148.51 / DSM 1962 / NBRC 6347 / NRRL 1970) TaxID=306901 RepID=Q2HGR2_CHAGB|nr:uncharacterized protein CHGG_00592 [Chaetomium globosum CBS 148.51]EAQ92357.1 hypothetical protein CHGG_00592 [Chaetomium globosum CBS 148.51]
MTNPYQQHDIGSNIDPLASGRLPPLNARRPSYASVVSGSPSALARPTRSGGFSHLLNPSPDSEQQQAQSSNPYSTTQNPRFETGMSYTHNGEELPTMDDTYEAVGGGFWPPRLGATFPYFSRAFVLYVEQGPAARPATPQVLTTPVSRPPTRTPISVPPVSSRRRTCGGTPPIAIGFASKATSTSRAPGWEPDSWGYHGDDGHSFASQNVGKPYADTFGVGDTIGCLVNFRLNQALFTLNGRELHMGFKDLKGNLYPIVGLKKKEDHIMANFGQRPFEFDIDGYMRRQQGMIEEEIRLADASKLVPGLSETDIIQQLVLQFLQHDGYVETARAFAEELHTEKMALQLDPQEPVKGVSVRDDEDAHNRQRIRRAVLEGDIDRAMKYTDAYYPAVLRDNEQVYFRLRCRKFIEMIRKEAEHKHNARRAGSQPTPTAGDRRPGDNDEEMFEAEPSHNGTTTANGDGDLDMTMAEAGDGAGGSDPAARTQQIIARGAVCHSGKSSRAALENVYAQTCVLLESLRKDGGDGAFVTVDNVVRDIPPSRLR